jgi:polyribonucleotide nucleotidyltransferase
MVGHEVERDIAGRKLVIESGRMGRQANGAALIRYADTVLLATVCTQKPRDERDFLPLFVDYREKQYAAGKFPGGVIKREGRPTTKEILTMRLTDRPLRPLFPKGFSDEVQVQNIVLSADKENDPDILSVIGGSVALALSDIPFAGPVGAVRLGRIDGELVVNPTTEEMEETDLDLVIAGTREGVVMVESISGEIPEAEMIEAIRYGQESLQPIIEAIEELVAACGKPKKEFTISPLYAEAAAEVKESYGRRMREAHVVRGKMERAAAVDAIRDEAMEKLVDAEEARYKRTHVMAAFEDLEQEITREVILMERTRHDGRAFDEVRGLDCEVALLPRTHGSALFTRGETQALVVATLGTVTDEQRVLDSLTDEPSQKFMLHYNFPPFSVGEVKPIRGPGRREIGHGNLAERALKAVLPDEEKFPYTIRLVSDIMESNGSSSMATVCGGTLALMDAGVPITDPVAGVAMGLIRSDGETVVLTDIAGAEDHYGDMDFKVAGTQHGITALQMDLKVQDITTETMGKALEQAREGRLHILRKMLQTLGKPRAAISDYAPELVLVQINPEKIGMVIGPGGRMIRGLEEQTGAKIEIEDDGTVTISGEPGTGSAKRAAEIISNMTRDVEVGKLYKGRVVEVRDFGAIVELFPGQDGLVHISELDTGYVRNVEDIARVGDEMDVKAIAKDESGRVKLSRKQALVDLGLAEEPEGESGEGREDRGRDRGRGGDRDRGRGGRGGDRGRRR